jgi:hypothetical protein
MYFAYPRRGFQTSCLILLAQAAVVLKLARLDCFDWLISVCSYNECEGFRISWFAQFVCAIAGEVVGR